MDYYRNGTIPSEVIRIHGYMVMSLTYIKMRDFCAEQGFTIVHLSQVCYVSHLGCTPLEKHVTSSTTSNSVCCFLAVLLAFLVEKLLLVKWL